ncbi:pyrroline-5-carboxylate reductase [Salinicoccus sp. ID82-1]|uniref:Pyrroline-5-carboxylate reductase n=1 Tax=Salinicoccus cyprini TaxID=2493691 RepID=A0A558AVK3_9STAP|nr:MULTISPECIES: pyrroline-5-carboxylate reductase [Salinicoccus]MCG1010309.1 pyrroline-5-carboxylate reductase [Salinicoccus sp. ID82-1]TVT28297.1 pyrroline-5-carboxylate reductase [Salinicoccus cyprini]
MKIVFYGAGNMASAIFIGMIENRVVKPEQIYLTSRSQQDKVMFFKENLGVNVSYDDTELLDDADYVILASKPQSFPDVAKRIRPYLEEKTKIVSVMAGTQIKTIRRELRTENPIARIMPNTNAMVQHSVSGITYSRNFPDKDQLVELMESFGTTVVVEEDVMHNITAATGSGSAFLYFIYEKYAESLMELGFSEEEALFLTRNLVIGAGKMVEDSELPFSQLRKNITSKKGTTEAGLNALDGEGIKRILTATLNAAANRSEELSKDDE